MRIALILKHSRSSSSVKHDNKAIIFNVEENKVIGVENEILKSKDIEYLSVWAQNGKIDEIFIPEANEMMKNTFNELGINIKKYDELKNNKLFNTFNL